MSPSALATVPPASRTNSTTSPRRRTCRSPTTSLAPSDAKRIAIARPIPDAAPVITTTLSFNRMRFSAERGSSELLEQAHSRVGVTDENGVIALDIVNVPTELARALVHGFHDRIGNRNVLDRDFYRLCPDRNRSHGTGRRHVGEMLEQPRLPLRTHIARLLLGFRSLLLGDRGVDRHGAGAHTGRHGARLIGVHVAHRFGHRLALTHHDGVEIHELAEALRGPG